MTKSTITKIWVGGLVTFGAGIVAAIVGVFLMLAYGGTFTQVAGTQGYEFNPDINGFFWMTVLLIILGGTIALIGSAVQLVAWVGGLVNSNRLPEKTWFVVLLLGGILSLGFAPIGFAAMLAYVVAAPDGSEHQKFATPAVPRPTTLAPTS